jgi:molybdopterin-containing oxidoreductase family membrane subunit
MDATAAIRAGEPAVTLLKRAFWLLGAALVLAGSAGVYDRFMHGHVHANYGSIVTWGLWVAAYIYFIGLSAGSFLISSLVYVFDVKRFEGVGRIAVFTAVVTLLLALLSISADLGHMERAWHVLAYPNFRSPMAWMIWLYSSYFVLLVTELWFLLRADLVAGGRSAGWRGRVYRVLSLGSRDSSPERRTRDRRVVRILATVGVPLAVMFHGGVGALFGVVAARPHWHSGMFPILFLLSALVSGGALLIVIATIFHDGWRRNRAAVLALGQLVLGLLLLDVLFQISEFLIAFRGGIPGHIAGLKLVINGPYWWVFWAWQIALGTLIPILLLVLPTRRDPHWVSLAAFLIAAGLFGMRLNIVIPGLAVEEIRGLGDAVATMRTQASYFPSLSEWLFTAAITGLGLLLFGAGELLLPRETETERVRV